MDINYIYELLQKSSQSKLIDYTEEHEKEIAINPTAQNAVNLLLKQMCTGEIESEKNIKEWFETLYLIKYDKNVAKHKKKRIYPTYIDFEKIIICLVKIESDIDKRKNYALIYPQNPICKQFLDEVNFDRDNIIKLKAFHTQNSNEDLRTSNSKIGIKEKFIESISQSLRYLRPSSYKPVTISQLYDYMNSQSHDFEDKQMYYDCLRELRDERIINFKDTANGCPVYFILAQ